MAGIKDLANSAYRDFAIDGVPASGQNDPDKGEIRALFAFIEQSIGGAVAGLKFYATRALLFADTTQPLGTLAYVYDDPTPANNTVYHYETGGWVVDDAYFEGVASVVQPIIDQALAQLTPATPIKQFPNNSLMDGGVGTWIGTPPAIQATSDSVFQAAGAIFEAVIPAGSDGPPWLCQFGTKPILPGEYVPVSVLVRIQSGQPWPSGAKMRVVLDPVQPVELTQFEVFDATHRRYYGAIRNTTNAKIDQSAIQVGNSGTAPLFTALYVHGHSHYAVTDVDWSDVDPFDTHRQNLRLDDLDTRVAQLEDTAVGVLPDLLVASRYYLPASGTLRLYRDGLTSGREESRFDISAVSGEAVEPADPMMVLTADRFSGTGYFYAEPQYSDTDVLYRTATSFQVSPVGAAGSPVILLFGDSIPYQTQMAAWAENLAEHGIIPRFIGSYPASRDGGDSSDPTLAAEARSSWPATAYTYASTRALGNGPFLDLFPIRQNGGSAPTFAITMASGNASVASISITAAGSGMTDGVWPVLIDPPAVTDTNRRAKARVTIAGGVATSVSLDDGGAGYTAPTTAKMVPSVAEYLALSATNAFDARWRFNAWIRPAVSGDDPSTIHNGFVFDFGFGLRRLDYPVPSVVVLGAHTNDIRGGAPTANIIAANAQMLASIKAYDPTIAVALTINGMTERLTLWPGVVAYTKSALATFGRREADGIALLPLYQAQDDKFVYDKNGSMAVLATDALTGQQTVRIVDDTHPSMVGSRMAATMLGGYTLCQRPSPVQPSGQFGWVPVRSTLIDRSGMTFTKRETVAYDAKVYDDQQRDGDILLRYTLPSGGNTVVGLDPNAPTDGRWEDLAYAVYSDGGTIYVVTGGTFQAGYPFNGEEIGIRRVGSTVTFELGGTVIHTITGASTNPLALELWINQPGRSVTITGYGQA